LNERFVALRGERRPRRWFRFLWIALASATMATAAVEGAARAVGATVSTGAPTADPAWPNFTSEDLAPPTGPEGELATYGRALTERTFAYIGPEVADATKRYAGNNLACQNCHLEAGTRRYGLPFVGVYGDFPQYRAREGKVDTFEDRINGCMMRSLNGCPLPVDSREMQALVAWIKYLGEGPAQGRPVDGRGSAKLALLDRAADPARGAAVYAEACASCHMPDGQGQRAGSIGDAEGYTIPPLWGPDSYNDGAGMNRLISAAGFIHSNMPNGTSWEEPALSVEDSWDVAAFIDSQSRPAMPGLDADYPKRGEKAIDAPYGPFADGFPPEQHK
jgi:thiosulfate dehydrogenase